MNGNSIIKEKLFSMVIPVYNSEASIENVCMRIKNVFNNIQGNYEIILVDDGSSDNSWKVMQELNRKNKDIKIISLMRNFSEHNAVITGLNYVSGDFVIIMDDDGQNPPEEIPKLINEVIKGYDVVYAQYGAKKHNLFRNLGSAFNGWVASFLLKKPRDMYLCSFKIIRRALVNELVKYNGPYPYIDGLIFRSTGNIGKVKVEHRERALGRSGYSMRKLVSLWLNMFTNFSVIPLRISVYFGLLFALLGFIMSVFFIIEKILFPSNPMGWASLVVAIFMFSGIQLIVLGMIGEYIGRIFLSLNMTPQYIIREKRGFTDNG